MNADDIAAKLAEIDTLIVRAKDEAARLRRDIDACVTAGQRQDAAALNEARRQDERSVEIVQLTLLVRDLEIDAKRAAEQLDWLSQALTQVLMMRLPRPWWAGLTGRRQPHAVAQHVDLGPLFDKAAYLRRYPDVTEAGMEPLLHYVMHGQAEGRLR